MVGRPSNRANQSLDRYLQEIGEVPLLTPGECPLSRFLSLSSNFLRGLLCGG